MTLKEFGFPNTTMRLIMKCTRDTRLVLKLNGEKLDVFASKRGLHQSDPMSPYLFALCMELSFLIQQKMHDHH